MEKDERMMNKALGGNESNDQGAHKRTGGSDLVEFLKGVRDQTFLANLQE
jgi:hypothetical protein